jgi:acyl carrier protein
MQREPTSKRFEPEAVLRDVVHMLEEMTDDWDDSEGAIGPQTWLVRDLGCSSLEIVELVVSIEDHFDAPGLPFQHLLLTPDGGYIDDLRVGDLAGFVSSRVGRAPQGAAG